ncbi:uncharacterized protein LOC132708759 [Cylas formicarius]|uniref:uncharacterized protein LOC132708759 n=1 Tax=Cylas formicarius TaxID=197179 RepID=UPI002958957F|nr:uncharacterized protein LOC132708759 [Cylas formicarius]
MTFRKYLPLVIPLVFFKGSASITTNLTNNYAEVLWNLSNVALQSRQNYPNFPYQQNQPQRYKPYKYGYGYPEKYVPYYPDYLTNEVIPPYRPYRYPPAPHKQPIRPTQQTIMDALFSIAQNDDLQCVPKLVCELASGTMTSRQRQGLNLPLNINGDTLLAFISSLNSAHSSPVLHFGKAAVLGFAAKRNTGSCSAFYSRCPSDPEKLIQYLNNHNGGFFRFFQGLGQQNNDAHYQKQFAEKRILNQPFNEFKYYDNSDDLSNNIQSEVKFPEYNSRLLSQLVFPYFDEPKINRDVEKLHFPNDDKVPYRKSKKLNFDTVVFENHENHLDIQKPLPNHVPDPHIFPDRTGTGELKLDFHHHYTRDTPYFSFPN